MFDSNQMHELAHLSRQRYERSGGGGTHKVYASSKAYDEARGYKHMTRGQRAVYEMLMRWRSDRESAMSGFRWDCHVLTLDTVNGEIPF
jgi:hypothetical protein